MMDNCLLKSCTLIIQSPAFRNNMLNVRRCDDNSEFLKILNLTFINSCIPEL